MKKRKPHPYTAPRPLPRHLQIALDVLSSPKGLAIVAAIASGFGLALVSGLWDLYSRTNSLKTDADYSLRHGAWIDRQIPKLATTQPDTNPVAWTKKP